MNNPRDVWRPNITGNANAFLDWSGANGALRATNLAEAVQAIDMSNSGNHELALDASNANSLYKGDHLQVPSVQVLMIIRV